MKKLQNNFTTPEQSKRLLELGVPADSADCFYSKFECETFENRPTLCYDKKYSDIVPDGYEKDYLPCWSLGRLIEVCLICTGALSIWCSFLNGSSTIEYILEYRILPALKDGHMDFSKWEEE